MRENEATRLIVEPAHAAQTIAKTVALLGGDAPAWVVGEVCGLGPWNATEEWELERWVKYAQGRVHLVDLARADGLVSHTAPPQRLRTLRSVVDLLETHPAEPRLLETIGDRLVELGQLAEARSVYFSAARECEFEGDPGNAGRLLWQGVNLLRGDVYSGGANRFTLIVRAARLSLAAEDPAELDRRLQRALSNSARLALDEEAVLLALRSSAMTAMGRARDARTLIAEAMELVENNPGEHAGYVHRIAARRATLDSDVSALGRAAPHISESSRNVEKPEDIEDVSLALGRAFALVTDGHHDQAARLLERTYVVARQSRKMPEAARVLYASGLVDSARNGPSPKSLELIGRAALLAEADSEAAFFFRVGELVLSIEAGLIDRAVELADEVDPSSHSAGVRFSFHQAQALLAFALDQLDEASSALKMADELALSQENAQDTGLQLQLWAEYFRRTGSIGRAADAIRQSLRWMKPGTNEAMRVLTVLEATRVQHAADSSTPKLAAHELDVPALIETIDTGTRLGASFKAACLAEHVANVDALLAAAGELDGVHHHTQARIVRTRAEALAATAATTSGAPPVPLTRREIEVLRCLAVGESNKEIALRLTISRRTVDKHVTNIYAKLQIHGRAAAATYWHTHCGGL